MIVVSLLAFSMVDKYLYTKQRAVFYSVVSLLAFSMVDKYLYTKRRAVFYAAHFICKCAISGNIHIYMQLCNI